MKKFFSYLLFICLCIVPFATINANSFSHAAEPATEDKTVFVVQAQKIANTTNGVFLYDETDECLKLLNSTPALSQSFFVGECIDMCSLNDKIYLLTSTGLTIFDSSTCQTDFIEVDNIEDYHIKLNVSLVNDKTIFCIYPLDTANDQNVLYGYNNGSKYNFYTIEFSQNEFNQTTNISLLDFIVHNNNVYLLKAFGQSITSFPITEQLNKNLVLSTATTLVLSDSAQDETIVDLKNLYTQTTSNIVISYETKTDVYEFDGNKITFINSVSHRHQEETFVCIDMSVNNNTISLLADNCFFNATFNGEIAITSKMSNPVCDIVLRSPNNFDYYTLTKQSSLITTLGSNQTTTLPIGSYVVEIADVYLADSSNLIGYKYVMYTSYKLVERDYVGTNMFGYIITTNNCLTTIEQPNTASTVKVFAHTKLFKLPSVVVNERNEQNDIIKNISANVPVKVINYVAEYGNTYNQTTTNYALVEVGGDVGFIDTKAIVSTDKRVILAIPNAQLISSANIYEFANTSSNILHRLDETTKIKIIGSRDSNGFLKIAYNDDDGNYYEGYVKAYNVNADSYTTLQIIGTVLVLLNVAFLIILLITKRKVIR